MDKRTPIFIVAAVLLLLLAGGILVYLLGSTWEQRGTIGDSFGMTNALFSGLAFAGVIYAILLQRQELALQRQELQLTREELSKSASAQTQSAETQRQLAQLNAYSALLTFKMSEVKSAAENAAMADPTTEAEWVKRHKELRTECVRMEARIENVLFMVGGKLTEGPLKSPEELLEDLKAMQQDLENRSDQVETEDG